MPTTVTNTFNVTVNQTQLGKDIPLPSAPVSRPSTLTLALNRVNATAASTTTTTNTTANSAPNHDGDDINCENSHNVSIETRLNAFAYI